MTNPTAQPVRGTLRLAFVGSSHVHTPDYLAVCDRAQWIEVVGLAEPDPATVHMLPDCLATFETHGSLPPHDVAVVMTDAASHDTICPTLAARRLFIEKPLAVDGLRASALAALLREAEKQVRSGFFLRHAPALAAVEKALRGGQIGRVRHARFIFAHPGLREGWLRDWPAHLERGRMGGGAFVDLAIHLIDAGRRLLGDLRPIACRLDGKPIEGGGQAILEGPGGEDVHIWASAVAPRVMLDIHLVGDDGELVLDRGRAVLRTGDHEEIVYDGPMTTPADGFAAALDAFRTGDTSRDLGYAVAASQEMTALLKTKARSR